MKKESSIVKNTIVLVIMTLILGAILGSVYFITKAPIEQQDQKKHDEALKAVLSDADSFDTLKMAGGLDAKIREAVKAAGLDGQTVTEVSEAKANGQVVGHVYAITSKGGYGGDIVFTLGIDKDGAITGISYLTLAETAGLGQRAKEDYFVNEFIGKKADKLVVTKTKEAGDDKIDALSGSTITTNCVVNGVNAGLAADRVIREGGK
jgi:electron transport complex protein RnfG